MRSYAVRNGLSNWREFCFSATVMSTTAMAQPPVKLRCVDRLRLATDHAGDLR